MESSCRLPNPILDGKIQMLNEVKMMMMIKLELSPLTILEARYPTSSTLKVIY